MASTSARLGYPFEPTAVVWDGPVAVVLEGPVAVFALAVSVLVVSSVVELWPTAIVSSGMSRELRDVVLVLSAPLVKSTVRLVVQNCEKVRDRSSAPQLVRMLLALDAMVER